MTKHQPWSVLTMGNLEKSQGSALKGDSELGKQKSCSGFYSCWNFGCSNTLLRSWWKLWVDKLTKPEHLTPRNKARNWFSSAILEARPIPELVLNIKLVSNLQFWFLELLGICWTWKSLKPDKDVTTFPTFPVRLTLHEEIKGTQLTNLPSCQSSFNSWGVLDT